MKVCFDYLQEQSLFQLTLIYSSLHLHVLPSPIACAHTLFIF